MIQIDSKLKPSDLEPQLKRLWELSGQKISSIAESGERTFLDHHFR